MLTKNSVLILLALATSGLAQKPAIIPNPSVAGSIQPNWALAADGSALLSWVEPSKGDTYNLRYTVRRGASWSEPRTIAAGRRFWRHPAEIPELMTLSDGTLLAHWVEKGKDSSDAEDILVSSSREGIKWT